MSEMCPVSPLSLQNGAVHDQQNGPLPEISRQAVPMASPQVQATVLVLGRLYLEPVPVFRTLRCTIMRAPAREA